MTTAQNIDNVFEIAKFHEFGNRKKLPMHPGIYFLTNISKKIVYYIGASQNIYRRCNSTHPTISRIKHPEFMLIGFISIVGTRYELSILEKKLIYKYKPKYNKSLKSKTVVFSFRIDEEDHAEFLEYSRILNISPTALIKNMIKVLLNKPHKIIPERDFP